MTETQLRFLRAIAERVAAERVVEVHLFAARRQGPVETGVAVVAALQEAAATDDPVAGRLVVYRAWYRHTIKGPDRGKWEFDCVAQADAPLVTVDAVVRGVIDRAGDAGEPERLGVEQWHAALAESAWATLA